MRSLRINGQSRGPFSASALSRFSQRSAATPPSAPLSRKRKIASRSLSVSPCLRIRRSFAALHFWVTDFRPIQPQPDTLLPRPCAAFCFVGDAIRSEQERFRQIGERAGEVAHLVDSRAGDAHLHHRQRVVQHALMHIGAVAEAVDVEIGQERQRVARGRQKIRRRP